MVYHPIQIPRSGTIFNFWLGLLILKFVPAV